ncbi:hypothetical protein MTsPCn9_34230 [Croceitalea sp. MTPC9]|uniref:type IV secretion system protein n=1 Tax=unclassified Croceitalea TaxID=2632280 RepID=UPI002B389FFA|nr:hypothetical protein MTsPCn6_34720 [Croceitalea sp. MTPC6]GMN18483.1 hypothetical protein MTsPCn9_34230 [Croceitalea sp. MTPC9]
MIRKTLLLISFLAIGFCHAQIPVTDAAANSSLVQTIAQGAKQVKQGLETVKLLKDAKKVLTTVNNAVRDINDIQEIYEMQKYLIESSTNNINKVVKTGMLKPKETTKMYNSYNNLFDGAIKSLEGVDKILTNNLFKMKDSERLEFIKNLKNDMKVRIAANNALAKKYWMFAETRSLNKLFKK